jgi:hypothetical protein
MQAIYSRKNFLLASFPLAIATLFYFYSKPIEASKKQQEASSTNTEMSKPILAEVPIKELTTPIHQSINLTAPVKSTVVNTLSFIEEGNNVPPQYFGEEEENESVEQRLAEVGERLKFEYDMLKDPTTGKIPKEAPTKALKAAGLAQYRAQNAPEGVLGIPSATIVPRGPNNLGGRTRAIAFDKRNPNIMLSGGVSSGLFRSTNGGTTWTRVSPSGALHSVTTIAQDPRSGHQDEWYYGTGEAYGNSASDNGSFYLGNGIWKSTDNGITWLPIASTQPYKLEVYDNAFDIITRIIVEPNYGYLFVATSNTVVYSNDGNTTWNVLLSNVQNRANISDVMVTPSGRFYLAYHGNDGGEGIYTGVIGSSLVKIAGTSAGVVNPASWNTAGTYGRIVMNYAPSNPDIVYVMYYSPVGEAKLFKWNNANSTWTNLSANLPNGAGNVPDMNLQGGYNMAIAVKPNDENTVFIGGINVFRSTNGFTSTAATTRIGGYLDNNDGTPFPNHSPDCHVLTFAPNDNNTLYSGTDGGIHKTDITGAVNWTNLNNDYVTYQYYFADLAPAFGSTALIGGTQDNGVAVSSSGTTHSQILTGDGGQVGMISYFNTTNFNAITSNTGDYLYRSIAPYSGRYNIKPNTAGAGIYVPYFLLDQDNRNYLYYASANTLYRTHIASTISNTNVTGNSATGWESMTGITVSGNIRSMACTRNYNYIGSTTVRIGSYIGSTSTRKLYIGTDNSKVYRLNDPAFCTASTAPIDITPQNASGIVSSIAVNPTNDEEVLITYSNYGVPSIYRTTNGGSNTPTWTNIEGAAGTAVELASARSCLIAEENTTTYYFIGTSTGLYSTDVLNGTSTVWNKVGTSSINNALVSQLKLRTNDNTILIATHGNGLFTMMPPIVLATELLSFTAHPLSKNTVELDWQTASEKNNAQFDIERSSDSKIFSKIGEVKGHGTTSQVQDYSYIDAAPFNGINYYRLKQIDDNGASTYSKIVSVEMSGVAKSIEVHPNPFDKEIFVNTNFQGTYTINVHDITGKLQQTYQADQPTFRLNTTDLATGLYILSVRSNNTTIKQFKIVKQ